MFNLEIISNSTQKNEDGGVYCLVKITMNNFEEIGEMYLNYWKQDSYIEQWKIGVDRILKYGLESSLLFTSTSLWGPNFAWILYLVDKKIIIQERVFLPGDTIDAGFSLEGDFYKYIGRRETHSEELEKYSEWIVDLNDLQNFANKLKVHK